MDREMETEGEQTELDVNSSIRVILRMQPVEQTQQELHSQNPAAFLKDRGTKSLGRG